MASIKVGIVEDELIIAHGITQALTSLGYDATVPAISYTEALGMIISEQPDILLLDIQLKGHKDGIDLAHKVREQFNIPFIFLTANADEATVKRAKEANPHAYLVKPFSKDELYAAIEICLHNFSSQPDKTTSEKAEPEKKEDYVINDSLFIKQGQKYQKIKVNDITHIESSDVYIYVYTAENKYLVRNSIQSFLARLGEEFLRIHKSFAVNTHHVDAISAESMTIHGAEVPIGRVYRDAVMSYFKLD